MKKYFIAFLVITMLCLTGCTKLSDKEIKTNFLKDVKNLKNYFMEGELVLNNNDDNYVYDVKVSYAKDDNYKVVLVNKANNYEQTILRNNLGVYVITPGLNKTFKFQSEWPYNNSQAYLLQTVAKDLEKDMNYTFEQKNKDYVFLTKVNYPNNEAFVKQRITLDDKYNLKKVEVLDKNDIVHITFTVKNLDKKATFNSNTFNLDKITESFDKEKTGSNEETKPKEESTMTIDESIFPLYLPVNTSLSNKEVIQTDNGQRVIMTFIGESPFIFVQETVSKEDTFTVIPTYGEPYLLIDTVGSLTDISYTWASNGIEYYIVSDVMRKEELLEVAKSINVVATIGEK